MLTEDQLIFLNTQLKNTGSPDWKECNGVINVNGNVNIVNRNLTQIPIQFGHVNGYFDCQLNKLTNLIGAPTITVGYFCCSHNKLTSLIGSPEVCGSTFLCENNLLTNLEGGPAVTKGYFYCHHNPNLNILYGIGHVHNSVYYGRKYEINELIIQRARENIFLTYTDIAEWIKYNSKYELLLYSPKEIRQYFLPSILSLVDKGIYK